MKQKRFTVFDVVNTIVLTLIGFCTLYPMYNMYIYAFNDGLDSLMNILFVWPRVPTLDNFRVALTNEGILNAFFISIARTIIGTLLTLLCTSSMAYAMTKRKMPGYKIFSMYFFITFLFGGGFVPYFLTIRTLGLFDTFWVLVIPGVYSYWYMVLFRSFFDSIPESLEESVKIDGGSYANIYLFIIIPLSKPVFAAIALFTAVSYWNEWFAGLFYIRNQALVPLQTLLQRMMMEVSAIQMLMQISGGNIANVINVNITPNAIRLATAVITITPIILVYPFLQKYFIKGIMVGAIKG